MTFPAFPVPAVSPLGQVVDVVSDENSTFVLFLKAFYHVGKLQFVFWQAHKHKALL